MVVDTWVVAGRGSRSPDGNDRQKDKCKSGSFAKLRMTGFVAVLAVGSRFARLWFAAFVVSHPSQKNKYPARVGHPDFSVGREKAGHLPLAACALLTFWRILGTFRRFHKNALTCVLKTSESVARFDCPFGPLRWRAGLEFARGMAKLASRKLSFGSARSCAGRNSWSLRCPRHPPPWRTMRAGTWETESNHLLWVRMVTVPVFV